MTKRILVVEDQETIGRSCGDPSLAHDIPHFAKQPRQGLRQRRIGLPGNHQQRIAGAIVDPVVGAGRHGQMTARHIGF
jgi:hypothetical protein